MREERGRREVPPSGREETFYDGQKLARIYLMPQNYTL